MSFNSLNPDPLPCELNALISVSQMDNGHHNHFRFVPKTTQLISLTGPFCLFLLPWPYSVNSCSVPHVLGVMTGRALSIQEVASYSKPQAAYRKL